MFAFEKQLVSDDSVVVAQPVVVHHVVAGLVELLFLRDLVLLLCQVHVDFLLGVDQLICLSFEEICPPTPFVSQQVLHPQKPSLRLPAVIKTDFLTKIKERRLHAQ